MPATQRLYSIALVYALFGCLVSACWGPIAGSVPAGQAPVDYGGKCTASAIFHGDTAFTKEERKDLTEAALLWRKATGGAACLTVIWDLDFDSEESLAAHQQHNVILKLPEDAAIVRNMDQMAAARVLGLVHPPGGLYARRPMRLFLVWDRMTGPGKLRQVATHEFGHVFGMQHTQDPWSTMYFANTDLSPNCLTRPDIAEFCRVNDCMDHPLKACE